MTAVINSLSRSRTEGVPAPLGLAFTYETGVGEVLRALEDGTLAHPDALRILGELELATVGKEGVGEVMLGEVVRGRRSPYPEEFHQALCACGCGKVAMGATIEVSQV